MTPDEHVSAAANLLEAERTGEQIGLLSLRHPAMTMDDAYAIQKALAEQKLAAGREIHLRVEQRPADRAVFP